MGKILPIKLLILGMSILAAFVGCESGPHLTRPSFLPTDSQSTTAPVIEQKPIAIPNPDFPMNERLRYKIAWLGIPVGIGEIWVKEKTTLNGREVYHVVGFIETNKFLSKIFPMHDKAHSWIDVETLESLQFEKKINERNLNVHEKMIFDTANRKGYFESVKTGERREFEISSPAQDVLSIFYWARRQALVPGKTVRADMIVDQEIWKFEIQVLGTEILTLNGSGKIDTIVVEPKSIVKGEYKRGKAWLNLLNDGSRKPVKITFKAIFGSVTGTLMNEKEV